MEFHLSAKPHTKGRQSISVLGFRLPVPDLICMPSVRLTIPQTISIYCDLKSTGLPSLSGLVIYRGTNDVF